MPATDFFRCLNCGHTHAENNGTTWKCARCGLSYRVEQDIPILLRDWQAHNAEIAQAQAVKPGWYLDEQPAEQVSPWRHHIKKRREYVERAIQSYLAKLGMPRTANLLDLGCGDGNHLEYLQKYADALYGSDYNLVRLVRSRVRHPTATLFLADMLDYPAQENFFDIIFFNHVIEHIPDDVRALQTVQRILKPGGLLILGTPNEGAWWWQLAYKLQPEFLHSTDHVHFYTADSLTRKMDLAGFQIAQVKHLGWGPPHWSLDGRIRKYKWVDDAFEFFGKIFLPRQASSLYALATK